MKEYRGVWLEDLTWTGVQEWIERDAVLLVPIGAISKEHGHHLPMKTDFLVARELANRVAERLPVLVAPVVTFGYYPAFVRYPGSQHLRAETFISLLTDVLRKFVEDGFRRIAIINTGVSTEGLIDVVVRDLCLDTGVRIHVASTRSLGGSAEEILEQKFGGHADEAETSTLLAIRPDLVNMERARPDYGNLLKAPGTVFNQPAVFQDSPKSIWDHSETGVRGDPSLATAEKGRTILEAMTFDLVSGLKALFPDLVS